MGGRGGGDKAKQNQNQNLPSLPLSFFAVVLYVFFRYHSRVYSFSVPFKSIRLFLMSNNKYITLRRLSLVSSKSVGLQNVVHFVHILR